MSPLVSAAATAAVVEVSTVVPPMWVDLANLAVAGVALVVTIAIFYVGRRLSFAQKRGRESELKDKAWKVLGPIRRDGLNSKIIVMNSVRYDRGYDGSNECTWRGFAYTGPEIIEIRHGGIQVLTGGDGRSSPRARELGATKVREVGHIPWSWIDDIDPDGNEYDGSAIFYVRHAAAGRSPFNYYTYVDPTPTKFGPNNRDYYPQREEYGTRRPRFFADWWTFLKRWRDDARMNKTSRAFRQ